MTFTENELRVPGTVEIGCVWELAPLEHERSAWVRPGLMPASPDLDGYLADEVADGPVGDPA